MKSANDAGKAWRKSNKKWKRKTVKKAWPSYAPCESDEYDDNDNERSITAIFISKQKHWETARCSSLDYIVDRIDEEAMNTTDNDNSQ